MLAKYSRDREPAPRPGRPVEAVRFITYDSVIRLLAERRKEARYTALVSQVAPLALKNDAETEMLVLDEMMVALRRQRGVALHPRRKALKPGA